jgi:hypothetical protein
MVSEQPFLPGLPASLTYSSICPFLAESETSANPHPPPILATATRHPAPRHNNSIDENFPLKISFVKELRIDLRLLFCQGCGVFRT